MAPTDGSSGPVGGAAVLIALLAGCTSYAVALEEFDSVTGYGDGTTEPEAFELSRTPARYPWLLRVLDGLGIDALFKHALSIEPRPTEVGDPPEFARARMQILADRAANAVQAAVTVRRLLWVLDLGGDQPRNQVIALRGLGTLAARFDVDPVAMPQPDPMITTRERVDEWFATIETLHPVARSEPLDAGQRAEYLRTLHEINELPLPGKRNQRALIGALANALAEEPDVSLMEPTREALVAAVAHGVNTAFRDNLLAVVAPSPLVRQTAMQEIRRLGGPPAVPFILASVSQPAALTPAGESRYDKDPLVRLALIRMSGQLRGAVAQRSHGQGPAAVEFLYETHAGDPDEGLRAVALEALAHALGRDVSFDPQWAERWWLDDYVPNRGAAQPKQEASAP